MNLEAMLEPLYLYKNRVSTYVIASVFANQLMTWDRFFYSNYPLLSLPSLSAA